MANGIVCITGGMGFIGLHLIQALRSSGYCVRVIDNLSPQIHGQLPVMNTKMLNDRGIAYTRADILDRKAVEEVLDGVDYLIHLASETGTAQSMYEIARYNAINSQGTAQLVDYLVNVKHTIKKVILSSSRAVYGEGAYQCERCGPVSPHARSGEALAKGQWEPDCPNCSGRLTLIATSEHSRPQPGSIYAATKLAQEDLVRIACGSVGIPFGILRLQNVYGEGQSLKNPYTGILSIFSTRVRQGIDLPIFEDGLESRDFVHVSDVVKAIMLCLLSERINSGIYNVGSGVATSVMDVARMLIKTFNSSSQVIITGQYRIGDIRHCYADISALHEATGFRPLMNLEDGLAAFATWVSAEELPEDGLDRANRVLLEKGLMK